MSLQKWKFQENSHMLETISGSVNSSLFFAHSLSLSLSVQGASREARKQKKKEHNPWHKRSEYLLTYQQELPICFPPPSSDLKTATFKGILQIRRQDRVAAADSPRRKKCGKWIEIWGKFGPRTRPVPLPPLLKKIRIDESDKILLFWFMIPEAAAAAGWIVVVSSYQE